MSMGKYSCPTCEDVVPPVSFSRDPQGEIFGPNDEGLLAERTRCPTCYESLERIPGAKWHIARCAAAEFRYSFSLDLPR